MADEPYTRAECLASDGDFPKRGPVCDRCGVRIPRFVELTEEDERRIRALIRSERQTMAMRELEAATGCPARWAKIWVLHSGLPATTFLGTAVPALR